jgi:hypothetical protein
MKRYPRTAVDAAAAILALVVAASGVTFARPALAQSSGASASAVSYGGGDGASFAQAILIKGARSEAEGVAAERSYVVKFHSDWDPREVDTALMENGGRDYDLSRYRGRDGVERVLYFDITEFFGKE